MNVKIEFDDEGTATITHKKNKRYLDVYGWARDEEERDEDEGQVFEYNVFDENGSVLAEGEYEGSQDEDDLLEWAEEVLEDDLD